MLSLISRRNFFGVWAKKFFFGRLLRPFVGVNSDFFKIFAVLSITLKIIKNIELLTRMLRLLCSHWAYGSGTHVHAERARQELMRALSLRVRNWCVHWAYASCTNVCTEGSPFKHAEQHTHQFRMRTLSKVSIRVRNWCVHWAFVSGTACALETKWCLAPPKIKIIILNFSPKVTYPERLYGVKIMKIRAIENLTLGHL
jgi:hypothetical protein